jgi:hypothetical protein
VGAACLLAVVGAGVLSACGGDAGGGTPVAGASSVTPTPSPPPCAQTSRCYSFAEGTEGWPDVNDDAHYANHDAYLDGTFRVGARESGTYILTAPIAASALAKDYGVRIEADATMGQAFPEDGAWGAACWTRALEEGGYAGFGAYVQPTRVTLGIFDEDTGAFTPLEHNDVGGLVKARSVNHLRLTCRQDTSEGSATADLAVELNGEKVVSTSYGGGVGDLGWEAADGVGLLAAGKDADVFFDNVEISGKP